MTPKTRRTILAVLFPLWIIGSFYLSQIVLSTLIALLVYIGVPLGDVNLVILNTVFGVAVYAATLLVSMGVPYLVLRKRVSLRDVGLYRTPSWLDIGLAPAGFIVYFLLSSIFVFLAQQFLPFIDFKQVQETGFTQLSGQIEYILAFFTLVILAPFAEEVLFRGYLFGKLRRWVPLWVAILITSAAFAFVHGQWNVGIDVFALSIILCLVTVISKSLWPAILIHMLKNFIAFYFLFINPTVLSTLGG